MFDLIFGLGNIIRALAVCGLPIGFINPGFLKQKNTNRCIKTYQIFIFHRLPDGCRYTVLRNSAILDTKACSYVNKLHWRYSWICI
jgi:hypothetical protein